MKSTVSLALLLVFAAGAATPASAAPRRPHPIDRLYVNPDLGSIHVTSIAMLPVVSFDNVLPAERAAGYQLMLKIRNTGYRWVSAETSRDRMRAAGGDSLLKANREDLLSHDRMDSLRVPGICALLRVNGLLALRLDQAEQVSIQSNESGKPTTMVQIHASLYDSTGTLVWSASGEQVAEGPEQEVATAGAGGGGFNGLTPTPIEEKHNAPDWQAALVPMYLRWVPSFPPRAKLAGGVQAASGAGAADSSTH